ncbi:MAG: hypothetical protein IKS25_07850 [Oscillospiraceae bacterium]|nr:hypothetical protein [Oscillospiraceae bacterium]
MPLPAAEEGMTAYPQPRRWRAVAKQARDRQCGKVGRRDMPPPAAEEGNAGNDFSTRFARSK